MKPVFTYTRKGPNKKGEHRFKVRAVFGKGKDAPKYEQEAWGPENPITMEYRVRREFLVMLRTIGRITGEEFHECFDDLVVDINRAKAAVEAAKNERITTP